MLRFLRSLFVACLLVAFAACGGDDKVSAADYAKSVCEDFKPIEENIEDSAQEFGESIQASAQDPEEARDAAAEFFNEAAATFRDAREVFSDAGTPDVDGGEDLADEIDSAVEDAVTELEKIADQAEELDTSSPEAFQADLTELGQEFEENANLDKRFDDLRDQVEDSGLQKEFDEQDECEGVEVFGDGS